MLPHILVSLGSTSFVLVPLQAGMPIGDLSRVLQGLIAGIGFLLAGTILKQQADKDGILELHLPKSEAAKPKRIAITS